MIVETFAPDMARTEQGWIQLPRDIERRRELFPEGVSSHPAKYNLGMVDAIVEAYSKPGDTILDPFGGTGSAAIACLSARKTILCELEPGYVNLLKELQAKQPTWDLTVIPGDCRQTLKSIPDNSINLVITSPPYPHLSLQAKEGIIADRVGSGLDIAQYRGGPMNLTGITNRFLFNKQMLAVYTQIQRILVPGGLYISITKDSMKGNDRELLSLEIVREAGSCGLKYTGDWWKIRQPGGMGLGNTINASKGRKVVEEEDVIVLRK